MNLSSDQLQAIRREAFLDPVVFCEAFLGEWFRGPIAWFQRGLLAVLTRQVDFLQKYGDVDRIVEHFTYAVDPMDPVSPRADMFRWNAEGRLELVVGRFTQLRIPRGFSKTTAVNTTVLRAIVYRLHRVVVNTSETATAACAQLKNIRYQLETNAALRAVFGDLVPEQRSGNKWTEEQIDCLNGVTVIAKGRGQQIRGVNIRGYRPSMIILDDIEDREEVKNPQLRADVMQWVYNDVMPALDDKAPGNTLVVIGTLLHSEAMLRSIEFDTRFTTIIFAAKLPDGTMLWPERFSEGQYEILKGNYARTGMLNSFYLEYANQTRVTENAMFRLDDVQYGGPEPGEELYTGIAIDPAISGKKKSAATGIAAVAISNRGRIIIREVWLKVGAHPREQIDKFFEFQKKYQPQKAGVESIAYQAALVHLIREEMFRKHQYFELEAITHKARKEERIEGVLGPRYRARVVWHERRMPEYEAQLADYPNGLVDGPDVVEMAISLLDPYAAQAADPEKDLAVDEYTPLDEDLLASAV